VLAILTSHPIQYQAPIWRAIAESGHVPFEVWFLTNHGVTARRDREFGEAFAWDIDLTSGYTHAYLSVAEGWSLASFHGVRLTESLAERMKNRGVTHLWVEGWRFQVFWDAVKVASAMGVRVWMRGDSNDLKQESALKSLVRRALLRRHLARVDKFLCVGSSNRRLYESLGAEPASLIPAPHCVDNDRFAANADALFTHRLSLRRRWNIPPEAKCVLFCGKMIAKKRPLDVVAAVEKLNRDRPANDPIYLLFVGSGELEAAIRDRCYVDHDPQRDANLAANVHATRPPTTLAGFTNQSQIAEAYVAADVLVLASDAGETWGLVVNECMAAGIPAVVSDKCGCAEDLPANLDTRLVFRCGSVDDLARALEFALHSRLSVADVRAVADSHHIRHTVTAVEHLYAESSGAYAVPEKSARGQLAAP
jgi:glycosyltransferase involved in cell wall biosynthesis